MYISHTSFPQRSDITIKYREDFDNYTLNIGGYYLIVVLTDEDLDVLYNEILGAMMHKRFAEEEVAVEVDLQD